MSRFPGLQFPTSHSGQPQTRQQQRPGVNLLQRLFAMKGDKLARQGQEFQEDSFNAAKEAYDGSLQTYEQNKAAHDASEKSKYGAAQSRYNSELGTYNNAKGQYDTQLSQYNTDRKNNTAQTSTQNQWLDFYSGKSDYSRTPTGYLNTSTGQSIPLNSTHGQVLAAPNTSAVKQMFPVTTQVPSATPTFAAAPPKFNYTTTPFGSDVPSFEYVAPASPGAANANKLASMGLLANQLQEVLPENARNRNRNPTSFYNLF
jgi:hypothetical protein